MNSQGTARQRGPSKGMAQLSAMYIIAEPERVHQAMRACPLLLPLLIKTRAKIEDYFADPEVVLDVASDLTTEGDTLVISINTDLPPEEAMTKLETFDEEWWLDFQDQVEGRLCIDVEFR